MNELDLTPFKVEFDREITIDDLKDGDYIYAISSLNNEKLILITAVSELIICGLLIYPEPIGDYSHFLLDRRTQSNYLTCIKAIYRINKFKY